MIRGMILQVDPKNRFPSGVFPAKKPACIVDFPAMFDATGGYIVTSVWNSFVPCWGWFHLSIVAPFLAHIVWTTHTSKTLPDASEVLSSMGFGLRGRNPANLPRRGGAEPVSSFGAGKMQFLDDAWISMMIYLAPEEKRLLGRWQMFDVWLRWGRNEGLSHCSVVSLVLHSSARHIWPTKIHGKTCWRVSMSNHS